VESVASVNLRFFLSSVSDSVVTESETLVTDSFGLIWLEMNLIKCSFLFKDILI